jgi:hypothetical protein
MPFSNEGLNVSVATGEGDANVLHWGATDKALDRLYAQQQQRKMQAENDYKQQQAAFQSELGKIRSVDVPEVVDLYNKRKAIKQQLLFDKKLQKDPVAYAQAQLAAKQAEAAYYGLVQGSKETLAADKSTAENVVKNHDLYDKAASGTLSQWMQIPTSTRRQQGLIGEEPLRYKGTNTDYGSMVKTAIGELQDVPIGSESLTPDKLSYQTQYYKRGAQPDQIKSNLIGQFEKKQAGQDAPLILSKIPQEEFIDINQRYDQIPNDQYKKLYGKDKPNLDAKNTDNPVEVLASFEAKRQVVTNPPQPSKIDKRRNDAEYLRLQAEKQRALENQKQAGRLALLNKRIAAAKEAKKMSAKDEDLWSEEYLNEVIKESVGASGDANVDFYAKPAIINDPLLSKAFEREGIQPDKIVYSEGKYQPTYYSRDDKGEIVKDKETGKPVIVERFSQPISKKQAKVLLLKVAPNSKRDAQEIGFTEDALGGDVETESEIGFQWED